MGPHNGGMLFWNAPTPLEAAQACVAQYRRVDGYNAVRREKALTYASCTEGQEMSSLSPNGYAVAQGRATFPSMANETIYIVRNVAHEVVDTFVASVGAQDPPLPAFLTTEGSWKDRRQAKDLERLVEAEYKSPKGDFATLNELWIHALKVAAGATGAVIVRFWNDCGKVGAKIHDSLDCSISRDGTWIILRTWYELDDAIELWEDRESDLRKAVQAPPLEVQAPQQEGYNAPEMVCVYEGWRGAKGDAPGTYVAALDGDFEPLDYLDYPHERPPCVKLVVDPHLYGPWGHSMVHHLFEAMLRDNVILSAIDKSISKTNKSRTFVERGALENPNAMESTEDIDIVYLNRPSVPTTESPAGFNKDHLAVADRHYADAHQVTGISEAKAGAKKEPGIDSAIGQRFIASLDTQRFAAVERRMIQAVAVDSAKVVIQILCDIYRDDKKLTRYWPGKDSLREVSGAVALRGIESLKYVIQPAAVSGSKNSPADRQQTAFELFKQGVISQDAYAGLQTRGYDLPEELNERDVQREWIDRQIEAWMFASDKATQQPDFYKPPIRHIDVPRALLRVIDGFLDAQLQELEDDRLEFFLMFMADLDALLAAAPQLGQQAPAAFAGQTAPVAPTPAGPPAGAMPPSPAPPLAA